MSKIELESHVSGAILEDVNIHFGFSNRLPNDWEQTIPLSELPTNESEVDAGVQPTWLMLVCNRRWEPQEDEAQSDLLPLDHH